MTSANWNQGCPARSSTKRWPTLPVAPRTATGMRPLLCFAFVTFTPALLSAAVDPDGAIIVIGSSPAPYAGLGLADAQALREQLGAARAAAAGGGRLRADERVVQRAYGAGC